MRTKFEMSIMGELTFFLVLKIKNTIESTSICQEKYINELLKKFNLVEAKRVDTPISTSIMLDKNEKAWKSITPCTELLLDHSYTSLLVRLT